ncbi:aminomethyl-transferring glycine dehydrogenase [Pseudohalocynthiibacter aestuariivivens]|jgi:glycine cleavage system P protein (glycine dehydrogenase)|uniref:Glycine dehydrogenase (decarboxylating) n=1 Tax=Pseudohalocynthiibacter aestuariivivens TaxID=1591409 RepID=A0ABV5JBB8_9RHOB|nr:MULTISPECIES: aminomethyl-transferring glycine dehydrogenase [Pseudohalocynthiibacter]MBS9715692.1 aminomethyl-transferring glycine dehydrogenase [Pseudohalocynthiibacter aestuariivivens]MCK0101304.1 aminomethyl-transferring glycine dehydrogenase [Pseudohalocynthiibacter sp. F2068]
MGFKLTDYEAYDFANRRHIGPTTREMADMLKVIGFKKLDELIDDTVPEAIRQKTPLDWGPAMTERDALYHMKEVAKKNKVLTSLIGQGYYGTTTPPVILRNILENPAWYTAYTPYQPEISQGRLEALLNFQTMVSDLTGLDIANASLLDESTAAAEAMTMAKRSAKSKSDIFFVDENCHPQNIAVIQTRAEPLGIEVIVGAPDDLVAEDVFGAIFQYPGTYGHVRDFTDLIENLHDAKALAVVAADPLALALLKSPGEMGADIAIGSTQRFGVPLGYGGPHAAYMATRDAFKRSMPGRIIGVSIDSHGNKAYRLALQTREQHIRREKANSNVCTAQALLAVIASMYAVYHGPDGIKAIAQSVHRKTARLAKGLESLGYKVEPEVFFDTITVNVGPLQGVVMNAAVTGGINLRKIDDDRVGISLDEQTRPETIEAVWRAFGGDMEDDSEKNREYRLPEANLRDSEFLTHPIFHLNRAEAEITRYMRRLADRDLALDRAMIPLGSCTMKLNATIEMIPVTWPEFSNLHPFVPADQAEGYTQMIDDLNDKLCQITGYDAISQQPNSGAQGEYAGLLTIRGYHASRGEGHRNICLIPTSAHGTNPASAQMVGWKVVPVRADENGNIDVADFREKAETHSENLAACMITYPSTHGVFEETVNEVCEVTHKHGGQVYIDGANMNAMVGLSRPGDIGGDVSHLNLHKTFCIPHGGGGPGMGPIGVKAHLAPYLPGHPERAHVMGPVSSAPFGSPSILPVSWAYCLLMGGAGLTQATKVAILNANYIAARLKGAFDTLYTSDHGRVAHECILDTRPVAESAGVTVDDIAKRLIDNGFHAPTMSWPVAGTLMVEPTESEPKAEIDRFCEAMLSIRAEAKDIADGKIDAENNPLKNAPHTVADLVGDWDRPYTRKEACYPPGAFAVDKYWPPVNRVDNAYGDRNLVCTCPPMSDYVDE